MFGWFTPKCPIDTDARRWIEYRMAWLIDAFGWERLRATEVVLPTAEYFPDPFDSSWDSIRQLLDRVAGYMDVDPKRIGLQFYDEGPFDRRTAGLYDERAGKTTIWLESAGVTDAIATTATLAHELGHVLLLGQGRVTEEAEDHELLTDLLTVFLGLGLFPANSVVSDHAYHAGGMEYWRISRKGYLNSPEFGYALSLFAWLREETSPRWADLLRPDSRTAFRQGHRYLEHVGDEPWNRSDLLPLDPVPCPISLLERTVTANEATDDREMATGTADDYATRATAYARHGQIDRAVGDLTEAIRLNPDDVECRQERAFMLAEAGRYEQAIADVDEALRLDPEDIESYRLRGMIRQLCGQFQQAIADLSRYIESQDDPDYKAELARAYFHRGLAWAALLEWKKAAADYTKGLRRERFADLYLARATAYTHIGKTRKAKADYREAEAWKKVESGEVSESSTRQFDVQFPLPPGFPHSGGF